MRFEKQLPEQKIQKATRNWVCFPSIFAGVMPLPQFLGRDLPVYQSQCAHL
jgi:hypothetical protein